VRGRRFGHGQLQGETAALHSNAKMLRVRGSAPAVPVARAGRERGDMRTSDPQDIVNQLTL
jgi:hypothetical protein